MNRRIAIAGTAGLALVLALAPAALGGKTFSSQA